MNCGLLGRSLRHSYSPQIHKQLGNYTYQLYEKEPEEIEDFLKNGDFTGLNVTIPYKKAVIPFCNTLSPIARRLGAVNTLVRKSDGTLAGHNTDYFGFSSMVKRTGLHLTGKKVLVLGSGGASATVNAVLQELGAKPVVISRSGTNNYQNLHLHTDAALIVNATPVGMYPNVDESPVDLRIFPALEGVLDLIYNPSRTKLLSQASDCCLVAENGLWMLVSQAKESAEWFTGESVDDREIHRIYQRLRFSMENLVLIGMPGCGKTTIGTALAAQLQRPFIDTDALICQKAGISIPEIFAKHGETRFRQLETEVIAALSTQSGLVISTGGGCVTRPENKPLLQRNSRVVWLKRDLNLLPTQGRPLSQARSLTQIYAEREPLYHAFAHNIIDNHLSPEDTIRSVIKLGEML